MSNWHLACSAVKGYSHVENGTPCQDKVITLATKKGGFIALADGAGSAHMSHYGAEGVRNRLAKLYANEERLFFDTPKKIVKARVAAVICETLKELSDEYECTVEDLSSTLLLFAVRHKRYVAFHIGDGVIGLMDGLRIRVLSKPYNGKYASTTRFTTDNDLEDALRMYRGDASKISGAILMSDGSSTSLYREREAELVKAVLKLFHACKEHDEGEMSELLEALLVVGMALDDVPAQHVGRPAAELHAALRLYTIADRDHHSEVVVNICAI